MRPLYQHTQFGWLTLAVFAAAGALLLLQTFGAHAPTRPVVFWIVGTVLVVAAMTFSRLTVRVDTKELRAAFGLGWPRRTVPLDRIVASEVTRTTLIEGWGIRYTKRGWLWNVSGLDAVLLRLVDGKQVMIGTDEPKRLKAALERALAARSR